MKIQDTLTKAGPVAQSIWQDDEFQDRIRSAGAAGREALAKKRRGAPPPTILQRVGLTLAESGRALAAAAAAGGQAPPRRARGRSLAPVVLVASGAAALLFIRQRDNDEAHEVTANG